MADTVETYQDDITCPDGVEEILEEKTTALKQLQVQMEGMLMADIKEKKCLHVAQIEKAYNEAIETVNEWRRDNLENIEKRHQEWLQTCAQATKTLNLHVEELESTIQLSKEQLSGSRVRVVTGHLKLTSRIDEMSASLQDNVARHRDVSRKLQEEINSDVVIERELDIRDPQISTPKLMFIKSGDDGTDIGENSNVLVSVISEKPWKFHGALTDGKLQAGRHYWELDLTFTAKVIPRNDIWVYSAGVVKSIPGRWYVGGCNHSWGVTVKHHSNSYVSVCRHGDDDQTRPLPVYPEKVFERAHVRQGFYLNCDQRTLTVLDCTYNRVLHTFRNLDMSEPLIPAVTVYDYHELNVTVRLRLGDLSNFFKLVPKSLWY